MAVHVPPRIYRRVPFESTVRLCYDRFRGFVEENSANLSLGGMFIQTDERPPVGTELSIEFRLEDGFELIRGTGRVTWVRDEPAGPELPAGVGVRFLELTPGSRELIFRLVDRRVKEGKTPFDLDEAAPEKTAPESADSAPAAAAAEEAAAAGSVPAPWSAAPLGPAEPRDDLEPAEPPRDLPPPAEEPPRSDPPPEPPAPEAPPAPPRQPPPRESLVDPAPPAAPAAPPPLAQEPQPPPRVSRADAGPPAGPAPVAQPPRAQEPPARPRPRWGRVALAATVAVLLLGAAGTWWAQRNGLLGSENLGGVLGPLVLHPDEVAGPEAAASPETSGELAPAALAGDGTPSPGVSDAAGAAGEGAVPAIEESVARAETPGRAPTRLENLTWSAGGGKTDLLLWTDGAVGPASYSQFRIGGDNPRLVVRLRGIEQPYARGQVAVGTPQVERIRTGFHSDRRPSELHVVFDLAAPGVELASIEGIGGRLRIVLEGP